MDINKVFDDIGEFGWYQFAISLLLASAMVPAAFSNLNIIFIMGVTSYWCNISELNELNITKEEIKDITLPKQVDSNGNSLGYSQCTLYHRNYSGWTNVDVEPYLRYGNIDNASVVLCRNNWVYDIEVYGETATTEWNLVCDNKWWQAAAASFFAFGMFAALLIYGTLADLFGRKPVLCVSMLLFIISNFATALAPGYIFLIVTRFLCGFFSAPCFGGTLVLATELIGPKWRAHVNAWCGYIWSIAGITMAGLAYLIKDWRTLQYTLSGIMIFFLIYFIVPESPRWLYMKGRNKEANSIFKRIAKANGKSFNADKIHYDKNKQVSQKNGYLWDMFRNKTLATKTVVICWNWFASSLCYYGLTLNSTNLGSNEYLSFVLSMLVEVPGIILCHFISVRIGRRWPMVLSMVLSGVVLFFSLLFKQGSTGLIVLVSVGKMLCTLAFNLLYVYTIELYPTIIRSVASSTANFISRLGSILAPFIAQMGDHGSSIPIVVFGVCSLSAGLLAIKLPETIGTYLEDTIDSHPVSEKIQTDKHKVLIHGEDVAI